MTNTIKLMSMTLCGSGAVALMAAQATDPKPAATPAPVPVAAPAAPALAPVAPVTSADGVATFYMVPMIGQMGTDINPVGYEETMADIKTRKPNVVVFVLRSADIDKLMYINAQDDPREVGLALIDEYRQLVQSLHDGMPSGIRQVMWVEDSVGFGSLMAMAWPEMYMKPEARLAGLSRVSAVAMGWRDPDVAAKMMAAWTGIGKGFLEYGKHDIKIGEAMMRPKYNLSATFVGRKVEWFLSQEGEWVLDPYEDFTVNFDAKLAEDVEVSKGTADTLEDLAFLLGYREFKVIQDLETSKVNKYQEDWRRAFDNAKESWGDFGQQMRWSGGEDGLKFLGQAKNSLEEILQAMLRFKAVEYRMTREFGIDHAWIEKQIAILKEQIIDAKKAEKQNRSSGNGGGGSKKRGGAGGFN
jgi:hypothetical protein